MLFLSKHATAAAASAKRTVGGRMSSSIASGAKAAAAAAAAERAGGGGDGGGGGRKQHKPTNKQKPQKPQKPQLPATDRPPSRQDPDAIRTIGDNPGSPFFELGLAISCAGQGKTRARQHVNPLRAEFSAPPPPPPDWSKTFADPTRPLVVDVGCGQGRFLLLLARRMRELRAAEAQQQTAPPKQSPAVLLPTAATAAKAAAATFAATPACNYLGIEIREALVDRANRWAEVLGLQDDVAFCFANATVALPACFLDAYPGPVVACLLQFPDPHWKKRHHKRRVLQPALARFLRDRVAPGGCVFLQSDIHSAAAAMRDAVEAECGGAFELSGEHFEAGATFPDAGPPPEQVRGGGGGGTDQLSKKQRMGEDQRAAAGAAGAADKAADDGGDEDGDDDGDDAEEEEEDEEDDDAAPFVSAWAREGGWLSVNPLGVPTEREHYVTSGGKSARKSIFRVLLRRRRG